jgi:hypothetical protein
MNILDIQDNLKNFSEDQLINEMQMPSGTAPQFLVLGEIKRRKKMRDELSARQAQNMPTVAEEAIYAAGMPQEGLAQMAQAMAPKSSIAQNTGIGSLPQAAPQAPPAGAEMGMAEIMPEMMPQGMPQGMPPAMPMASGGLLESLFSTREANSDSSRPEIRTTKSGRKAMYKPGTNIFLGFINEEKEMAEGGVLRAQQGMYMPEDPRLRALMMQESRGDPMATGSVGEIGAFQIRPETALMPGYGIKSLFPEISSEIGAGKKYRTPAEAYEANKDLIDATLRDTQKAEAFASDYLTQAESRLGSPEAALLSYNRGISGAGKVEDPTQDPYYQGVMSFMGDDGLPSVLADRGVTAADLAQPDADAGLFSAMAATPSAATQMPNIPPNIIKDASGRAIGDASYGPRIRAAMEAGDEELANQLVAQGLNEANFFEQMYKNIDPDDLGNVGQDAVTSGIGSITTPVGPETIDPAQMMQVLPLDPTQKTISGGTVEEDVAESETVEPTTGDTATTPPAAGAPAQSSGDDIAAQLAKMMTFSGGDSSSGVEQEIIDLQKDLAKSREQDKWLALGQAGLALMSSTNPTLLGAVGEAGLAGVKSLKDADESYREGVIDLINARSKLSKGALSAEDAAPLYRQVLESLGETEEDDITGSRRYKITGTARLELVNLLSKLGPKLGIPPLGTDQVNSLLTSPVTANAS